MIALLLLACDPQPEQCATGKQLSWVISELRFARRDEGVVDGFDIDGSADAACGHEDLVSPSGVRGIDNNFSALVPILEQTEAVAAESLIEQSIASGELMLTLTLDGLDDWKNDSCVDFALGRAGGVPLVAPDGRVLPDQTLDSHPTIEAAVATATAADGRIEVSGLAFNLPLDILNAELDFVVTDGSFWVKRRWDGALVGVMGGQVPIAQITEILLRDDVNLAEFVPLVQNIADIPAEDGTCAGISLGFEFVAVPVYLKSEIGQ